MLNTEPPENWNNLIKYPIQSKEFSELMKHAGYKPYYFVRGDKCATIHVIGRSVMSRAFVYFSNEDKEFVEKTINEVKKLKIPYCRVGNNIFGPEKEYGIGESVKKHSFVIDLRQAKERLWEKLDKRARNSVNKAIKEGLEVSETRDLNDLAKYAEISDITAKRAKEKGFTFMTHPKSLFLDLPKLIEKNLAKVVVAKYNGEFIAGGIFLTMNKIAYYWHGCSVSEHREKQAPSLIQWFIIEKCKQDGFNYYDLGGATPDLPETDSRYFIYKFKKQWGGELKQFYSIEFVFSKLAKNIQDKIVKKAYLKLKPLINKIKQ